MRIAPVLLLTLTSAFSALAVPSITKTSRGLTNGQRLARGLHPKTPKRFYRPNNVLRAVASPTPGPPSCSPGQYLDGETCLICPENTYSLAGSLSCIPCEENQVSPPGSSECHALPVVCLAGTYLSDGTCLSCPENTYSLDGAVACTSCPDGSTSPPGSAECHELPTMCDPGFYVASKACVECPAGTFSLGGTADTCTSCPDFWTSPPGSSECSPPEPTVCPPGFEPVLNECSWCPAGTYGPTGESCIPCPDGQNSSPGAESCSAQSCPAGQHLADGACATCPPDTFSLEGAVECTACPSFEGAPEGSSSCTPNRYFITSYAEAGNLRGYMNYGTAGRLLVKSDRALATPVTILPADSGLHAIALDVSTPNVYVAITGTRRDLSKGDYSSTDDSIWNTMRGGRTVFPVAIGLGYGETDIFDINAGSGIITPIFNNFPQTSGTTALESFSNGLDERTYVHRSYENSRKTDTSFRTIIKLERLPTAGAA